MSPPFGFLVVETMGGLVVVGVVVVVVVVGAFGRCVWIWIPPGPNWT